MARHRQQVAVWQRCDCWIVPALGHRGRTAPAVRCRVEDSCRTETGGSGAGTPGHEEPAVRQEAVATAIDPVRLRDRGEPGAGVQSRASPVSPHMSTLPFDSWCMCTTTTGARCTLQYRTRQQHDAGEGFPEWRPAGPAPECLGTGASIILTESRLPSFGAGSRSRMWASRA